MIKFGTIVVLTMFSTSSLAVPNPANLIQSNYWYGDDDIRAVIKSRVGTVLILLLLCHLKVENYLVILCVVR